MAKVFPFCGLRYSTDKVSLSRVVTQPYDKISKEMQDRYYSLDPHNIIRIILGKAESSDSSRNNVYTRAAATLREWRESGVLTPLKAPAFLAYFQRFTIPGTEEQRVRKGFIGIGRLEDYANKVVFPHERTLRGPKEDRLQLLRHTRTHFEQIFMVYEDPGRRIDSALDEAAAGRPDMEATDEYGVVHTLWIIDNPAVVEFIQTHLADKRLIIADGHHRYETALVYRDSMRSAGNSASADASYERMPMTFFNMHSPGLTILPTHRVVSRLKQYDADAMFQRCAEFFEIRNAPQSAEQFRSELKTAGADRITIGLATGGRQALLSLRPDVDLSRALPGLSASQRALDVAVLHQLLIEKTMGITEEAIREESHITYLREFDAALKAVREGTAQAAFLLNPTKLEQMRDIAYEGNVMPQKSTDFYPKVLSGLIMYSVEE